MTIIMAHLIWDNIFIILYLIHWLRILKNWYAPLLNPKLYRFKYTTIIILAQSHSFHSYQALSSSSQQCSANHWARRDPSTSSFKQAAMTSPPPPSRRRIPPFHSRLTMPKTKSASRWSISANPRTTFISSPSWLSFASSSSTSRLTILLRKVMQNSRSP